MKFTARQMAHTLKWNCINLWSDIRLIPFTLKLKALAWWYGGGKNIPPEKLGNLGLVQSAEEAKALKFAVGIHKCVHEIADKFQLPEEQRQLAILVAHWFTGNVADVELNDAVTKLIHKQPIRMALYKAMRACDDITDDDLKRFHAEHPNGWSAFIDWLKEPQDYTK